MKTQAARPGWGQGAKTEDFPLQMLSGLMFGIGSAWKAPRAWSSAGKSSSRRDGGGAAAPCRAGTSLPGDTGVPGTLGVSLPPRGGPWHIRGVPGTSGGSLAALVQDPMRCAWCAATLRQLQPPSLASGTRRQDDAASSINPSRAPGVAQRDLGGTEQWPQRCLCSRGGTSGRGGLW